MADALNSHLAVSAAILDQGADYLVYIKKNGSKELRSHLEGGNREYAKQEKSCTLIRENIEKEHGRIDETIIKVLSASELSERINCRHQGIRSIVRHTKLSTKIINGQLVHLGLLEHRATLQPP